MGKFSGKPGPDKKPLLDSVIIPTPLKQGGASGSPLKAITKVDEKNIKKWMGDHKA